METVKLNTKLLSTVASIWIQCTSGSLYTFSIYSPTLKSTLGYDQSTLDTVSVFKDIGANCGVLSGVLYSKAATHHHQPFSPVISGPWVVLLVGSVQSFLGYFLIWVSVTGLIPAPPVPAVCLFMFLAAHAQSFFNTADVVTSVRNFPSYSGTAVGIMKGFLGLSGAILIQVYQILFNNKPTSYLLLLALLPSLNPILLMWFVRIYNANEEDEKRYLDSFSVIALVLAAYLMIIIIFQHIFNFEFSVRVVTFALLLVLLVSPLFIAIRAREKDSGILSERNELADESEKFLQGHDPTGSETELDERSYLRTFEDLNLWQAAQTVDFWIMFLAMACGMGSGLATVNNLSQVGGSLGYASNETNTLVSLWSIWNFLGRFGSGYTSDYFLHTRGWARPLFMAITLFSMTIGHLMIASGWHGSLYAGSILVGVCYGSQWSLMPTIASEIFGVGHMGTIFNAITIASPIGSYIFSVQVIGYIYDKETTGGLNTCSGTQCFMLSFLIMGTATFMGSLAALGLFFRRRSFYERVIIRRLQHSRRV